MCLLNKNKTGQPARYITFPRCAFVHVLEEMKSLQCSCHDLAALQILSTLGMRAREKGWVTDPQKTRVKTWVEPSHPVPSCLSQKDINQMSADKSHILHPGDTAE